MDKGYKHLDRAERSVILAEHRARRKRGGQRRKLAPGGWLHDFVRGKLINQRWSPEQIARKLMAMHPDDPTRQISHEAIYAAIYAQPRGGLAVEPQQVVHGLT